MSDPIDEALRVLIQTYPAAFSVPDAIAYLAAATGIEGGTIHYRIDLATEQDELGLDQRYRLVWGGWTTPNTRRPPLPLTSPDGRAFAWACAHCQRIGRHGEPMSPDADDRRRIVAQLSLTAASACGNCFDCKTFQPVHDTFGLTTCPDCKAKRDAVQPNGEWVACVDCGGGGRLPATFASGRHGDAECPTCEGDGRVWRAMAGAP